MNIKLKTSVLLSCYKYHLNITYIIYHTFQSFPSLCAGVDMVHRSRGHAPTAHKSGPGLVAGHALYHAQAGTMAGSEQQLVTVCQCNTFLDPYPSGQSAQWR